jgi:pyridoxal 5'-phosphate synthase pdxT subunit
VILSLVPTPHTPPVEILARLPVSLLPSSQTLVPPDEDDTDPRAAQTIVALRQGHLMLTTFHPELTPDARFHEYFLKEIVIPGL